MEFIFTKKRNSIETFITNQNSSNNNSSNNNTNDDENESDENDSEEDLEEELSPEEILKKLDEALLNEDYELASRLRDELEKRNKK